MCLDHYYAFGVKTCAMIDHPVCVSGVETSVITLFPLNSLCVKCYRHSICFWLTSPFKMDNKCVFGLSLTRVLRDTSFVTYYVTCYKGWCQNDSRVFTQSVRTKCSTTDTLSSDPSSSPSLPTSPVLRYRLRGRETVRQR